MNIAILMLRALRPSPDPAVVGWRDLGFYKLDTEAFGSATAISIDYAVMEKTPACGGGAGRVRLVRRRLLACGVELSEKDGTVQRRAEARVLEDLRNCNVLTDRRWSRWKVSMTLWWSRRRTPSWCRGRKMPTV